MNSKRFTFALIALAVLAAAAGSCVRRLGTDRPAGIWTPAPISGSPMVATPGADQQPAAPAQPIETPLPSTQLPPAASLPATAGGGTATPNVVVITEADVLKMVALGIGSQSGATMQGVTVDFAEGKMTLGAASVTYGSINIKNLVIVGRLVAVDGRLQLKTDSITPRGLVTAMIPSMANQALGRYTSQYYVEDVRTLDGRLELVVR